MLYKDFIKIVFQTVAISARKVSFGGPLSLPTPPRWIPTYCQAFKPLKKKPLAKTVHLGSMNLNAQTVRTE